MQTSKEREADELEARARELRDQAYADRLAALRQQPLSERLIYAATARCDCGAGMAYDPAGKGDPASPLVLERNGPRAWECSDILRFSELGAEERAKAKAAMHTAALPFAFYEIKSEGQPSADGMTTRPQHRTAAA